MMNNRLFSPAIVMLLLASASIAQTRHALTFDGLGPVRIGMTMAQASRALGVPVTREEGFDDNICYYSTPSRGFKDIAFMMAGTKIVRIDVGDRPFATDKGVTVGDTAAKVKRLYRGMFTTSKHAYVEGQYIEVRKPGSRNRIVFETEGNRVTRFRVGLPEPVRYIEGCS